MKGVDARKTHPFTLALAVLLAACTLATVLFWQDVREYYLYFRDPRPALSFDFDELSESWSERELHVYFEGAKVFCQDETEVRALGDRSCFIDINTYNGAPAMTIGFFFADGRLNYARLAIPFWAYSKMHHVMVDSHGPASLYKGRMAPEPLDVWRLKSGGALFLNRDPLWNPVSWHQLFWASSRACDRLGC